MEASRAMRKHSVGIERQPALNPWKSYMQDSHAVVAQMSAAAPGPPPAAGHAGHGDGAAAGMALTSTPPTPTAAAGAGVGDADGLVNNVVSDGDIRREVNSADVAGLAEQLR